LTHALKEPPPPYPTLKRVAVTPPQPPPTPAPIIGGDDDIPPPPENFPDDWDTQWQPSFDEAEIAARPDSASTLSASSTLSVVEAQNAIEAPALHIQSLYVPLVKDDKDKEHPPRQITILLRPTGDHERDKRRIKTLHGLLTSSPGRDKFSFQIFENGKGHLIDFPNDTTRINPELMARLKKLMGEESWRVEEIA
jgi:hypothetical protein